MEKQIFEDTLRANLRRKPFLPFVVEKIDGESIVIDEPSVAFDNGFAVFLSSDYSMVEFRCEDVSGIGFVTPEETTTTIGLS